MIANLPAGKSFHGYFLEPSEDICGVFIITDKGRITDDTIIEVYAVIPEYAVLSFDNIRQLLKESTIKSLGWQLDGRETYLIDDKEYFETTVKVVDTADRACFKRITRFTENNFLKMWYDDRDLDYWIENK